MPYTPPNFVDGTTPLNQTNMNALGTQYSEAMQSFNQDLFSAFVESGLVASRHNSYASNVLGNTPLQYFRLDESSGTNAFDSSGNGQAGTYVASPTLGAAGLLTGDPDAAVTLNGTTQYATIPTTNLPTGAGAWTMEAWAKPSSGTGSGAICSFGDSGSNGRSVTLAQLSAGGWQVFTWGGTVVSGGTSAAGVIHHVVATFDGTSLRLYVDGALVAGPTAPGVTVNVSGTHAAIGALYNGSYGSFFGGTVDEVAIYGSALSAATITAHYNAGTTATTQVDVTSGVIVATQSDGTTRRRAISSASFNTVTANANYYLDANPDGTTNWATSHSAQANYLRIAVVTTDGSGNVSIVGDSRTTLTRLLPNAIGLIRIPGLGNVGGQVTAGSFGVPVIVAQSINTPVTDTANHSVGSASAPASGGLYRISLSATMRDSASANITAKVSWPDPVLGATIDYFTYQASTPIVMNGSNAVGNNLGIATMPLTVYAVGGTINVNWQHPTGSPNDIVSVVIERLG